VKGAPAIPPKYGTLNEMLAAAAQTDVSFVFVNNNEEDQQVPLARIRAHALSIAADLMRLGVQKSDRVAIVLPTSPDFVECFFGVRARALSRFRCIRRCGSDDSTNITRGRRPCCRR
jgi:fatty-acyl-CoA synthase